jgi:hypothetical protein
MKISEILESLVMESILSEAKYTDLKEFLNQGLKEMTMGTAYYVASMDSSMNKNIVTPEGKIPNPMYGKLFKHTRYMFRWKDTYGRAVERTNPEHVMGQRRGEFDKVQGYEMLEQKGETKYLPIIPTGSEYKIYMMDGGEMKEVSREEVKQYLKPSGPSAPSSGVDFRLLMISKMAKLTGGGNEWVNPEFSGEYKGLGNI